jgi:hypothetical protein
MLLFILSEVGIGLDGHTLFDGTGVLPQADSWFSRWNILPDDAKSNTWKTDTANQRGGEWMGADKYSSRRRWRIQQDEHGFQHMSPTHYPSWPRPRSHCSATSPRNQQPTSQTWERSGTQTSSLTDLHRSGRWAPPVRPVPAGETWWLPKNSSYTGQAGAAQRSDRFKPESPKTPNRPTELQTDPKLKQ